MHSVMQEGNPLDSLVILISMEQARAVPLLQLWRRLMFALCTQLFIDVSASLLKPTKQCVRSVSSCPLGGKLA